MIQKIFRKFGIEISRYKGVRSSMSQALSHLKSFGYNPRTVLDIGVAYGTPELYEAFPNSRFILIEPLEEFQKSIQKIQNKYNAIHLEVAVGAEQGQQEIGVSDSISTSGFFFGKLPRTKRIIQVETIDNICSDNNISDSVLLKLDIEGGELIALAGAVEILKVVEVIILEVTFSVDLKGAPEFLEVLNYMDKLGFVMFDIFSIRNKETSDELSQADVTFVRKNGGFRS